MALSRNAKSKYYIGIAVVMNAFGTREIDRIKTKKCKTYRGAVGAAWQRQKALEYLYPWYQTVRIEVYENGKLIEIDA
jgi:hypothetical protein